MRNKKAEIKQQQLFKEMKGKKHGSAISIQKLLKKKYKDVELSPEYAELLGDIEGKCTMMAYGKSGFGKSVWVLKLINYLAEKYGKVLYNSHEEKLNKTLQDRVRTHIEEPHMKVQFAAEWDFRTLMYRTEKNKYRVIVIDSVQYMGFTYDQLIEFREFFAKRNIILIMISFGTGAGKTTGADALLHASDVKLYFHDGKVTSTSRYIGKPITKKLFKPKGDEASLFSTNGTGS